MKNLKDKIVDSLFVIIPVGFVLYSVYELGFMGLGLSVAIVYTLYKLLEKIGVSMFNDFK